MCFYCFSAKAYEGSGLPNFLEDLHKKYGPIVSMKAGVQTYIFIDDKKLVRDLFNRPEFAFRPVETFPAVKKLVHGSARGLFVVNKQLLIVECSFHTDT